MSANSQDLGKAVLDLEVNKAQFSKDMREGRVDARGMEDALDAIARVARLAETELNKVQLDGRTAAESNAIADRIERSISGVSRAAMEANEHLEGVKLDATQAAESKVAAEEISEGLNQISRNADQAKRKLTEVKISQSFGSKQVGGTSVSILGGAIAAGTLLTPAAGPAVGGLLASLPVLATTGVGALGTLALAFHGVTAAIEGDKKAFDALQPSQQAFVQTIRSLSGAFDHLQETAGNALFPGLTAGLKDALSQGTWSQITRAVTEFGHAIGTAGEMWGRYFGSAEFQSIFGPLMAAGAHDFVLFATAALHLADAIGVIAKAAIPLTTWLANLAVKGSQLFDTWAHGEAASGGLAKGMNEARQSLQLVGGVLTSLVRALGALGDALYPVSKVALKDLINGLNALADLMNRNKGVIREIVSGALADLVAVVKTSAAAIGLFNDALGHIVGNKAAIVTAILAIGAAIAIALGPEAVAWTAGIIAVGELIRHWSTVKSWFIDFGKFLEDIFKATWQGVLGVADVAIYGMLLQVKALAAGLGKALGWVPGIGGKIKAAMHDIVSFVDGFKDSAAAHFAAAGQTAGDAWSNAFKTSVTATITNVASVAAAVASGAVDPDTGAKVAHGVGVSGTKTTTKGGTPYSVQSGVDIKDENAMIPIALKALAQAGYKVDVTSGYRTYAQQAALYARYVKSGFNIKYIAAKPGTSNHESGNAVDVYVNGKPVDQSSGALALLKQYGLVADVKGDHEHLDYIGANTDTSLFGDDPAFTKNLGKKPPKPPVIPTLATHLANLAKVNAGKATGLSNTGGTAKRYLENELSDLQAEQKAISAAEKKVKPGSKDAITLSKALAGVTAKIPEIQKLIRDAIVKTGDALLPTKLKTKLTADQQKFKADTTFAQSLTGKAAQDFQTTLLGDLSAQGAILKLELKNLQGQLAGSTGKQKAAIQKEIAKVKTQLQTVNQEVVSQLQTVVSTLQSQVGTFFSNVTSELDASFEAATQKLLDSASLTYYQSGAQTPFEKQLADMQAADTVSGLNDALTQAQQQLATDTTGGGDAPTIAADNAAIASAQRAIDENNLSIQAATERAKADSDYAAAVKKIQDDRQTAEAEMNRQLSALGDSLQNGTGSISDLSAIAAAYGLQIDTTTIPDFDNLSSTVGELQTAFQSLADYIGKLTGVTPKIGVPGPGPAGGTSTTSLASLAAAAAASGSFAEFSSWVQSHGGFAGIPSLDIGGTVLADGIAQVHRGEIFSGVNGETFSLGGSGDTVLMVDGHVLGRVMADQLSHPTVGQAAAANLEPWRKRLIKVGPAS